MKRKIIKLILAGDRRQFCDYCRCMNIKESMIVRYITREEQLMGFHENLEFIKVGTWWGLPGELIDAFDRAEEIYKINSTHDTKEKYPWYARLFTWMKILIRQKF